MTLNALSQREDPCQLGTNDNINSARDKIAQKITDNLPKGWAETSMMNVSLYTEPPSTLEELMKQ